AREHALMRQFMKQDFSQVSVPVINKCIQQRVFEHTERGVSFHSADKYVIALLAQRSAVFLRSGLGKVAAIFQAANPDVPPALWLERELRSPFDVPHHERAMQIGKFFVVAVDGQFEIGLGEGTELLDDLETRFQFCGRVCISEDLLDRFLAGKHLVLACDGLAIEVECLATRNANEDYGEQSHDQPAPSLSF